ncbi:MAG: EAL domain-containing protein [Rhodopila sp.]|nr:EAL domain-containing protein [Rhodopila sp.]
MLRVVGCITQDYALVALACLVCLLAAHTSVRLLTPGRTDDHRQRAIRTCAALLTFGTGVWSSDLIGILAFHPGLPFSFDGPLCALPLILAIAAMGLLARRSAGWVSAFLALAVTVMHFTAMASVRLDLESGTALAPAATPKTVLIVAVGAGCFLILSLVLAAASTFDRYLTNRFAVEARRFRTLADAAFEGLIFEREGRIIDTNLAMRELAGTDAKALVGRPLADLIPGIVRQPSANEQPTEYDLFLPDGRRRPVEILWRDGPDRGSRVVAVRDLSRQKASEARTKRLARFDPLTGLPNREMFEQQLRKALALSDRAMAGVALLYVDLDRFGVVSEALGQAAGEQILIQAAQRLTAMIREADTVARLGRDEFAIIQSLTEQPTEAAALAERVVTEMALPYTIDDQPIGMTACVGVALYPAGGTAAPDLIKSAVLAMRGARDGGRGRWRYFEPGMDLLLRTKRSLGHDLRTALKEGQFSLNYQPFVEPATLEIAGYEALLRWDHPERGRVPPAEFIPLAEEFGLIVPIGNWVLTTACAEAASWGAPVIIAVNLSPAQFVQPGIVGTVAEVLRETGLPPNRLELEITEGTLMDDTQNALGVLTSLKALGVKIAMDDFGTGYSSLSYLRKFPFDKIKIDRSFISDVEDDTEAETIVQAIIAMSRSLRLDVTAEGVETRQQLAMLRAHGCTFVQGYLLGRPRTAAQLDRNTAKMRWPLTDNTLPRLVTPVAARSAERGPVPSKASAAHGR